MVAHTGFDPPPAGSREPLRFAHWVPNVSADLVASRIGPCTAWSFDYDRRPAQPAEGQRL